MIGYPVALTLAGSALIFAGLGSISGHFDMLFLGAIPERIFGIMMNDSLIAVPLFVFMGMMLERSKISEDLLETMSKIFGSLRGGLGISVCLVGGVLAASTGIVGATVVTMGLISLPTMLRRNYSPSLASGIICASGTLGQIIPPSIVLIILGDVISTAHQQAQLELGVFSPISISVGDLFTGAVIPGFLLMTFYLAYVLIYSYFYPASAPALPGAERVKVLTRGFGREFVRALLPPLVLIIGVLGSIFAGIATPTEAAAVGSIGSLILAIIKKQFSIHSLKQVMESTTEISAMVFFILIGASLFSLVFRGFDGDELVKAILLSAGKESVAFSFFSVMAVMFFLGFFLDFFEITFVIVPIVGPALLQMGLNPIWLGVMIALNLQTSFLTPPFGFSLFYFRGVAPEGVTTKSIYLGVIPFIAIQLFLMLLIWFFPGIATWLPVMLGAQSN